MRVEKEYTIDNIKITIFYWNNKFLLKFEQGDFEQTYKFSEFDFIKEEVEGLVNDAFIKNIKSTFNLMNKNIREAINQ